MDDAKKNLEVAEWEGKKMWSDWSNVCNILDLIDKRIHQAFLTIDTYIREGKSQPIYPKYYNALPRYHGVVGGVIHQSVQEAASQRIPSEYQMSRQVANLLKLDKEFRNLKRSLSRFLKYDKDIMARSKEVLGFIKENRQHPVMRKTGRKLELLNYDEQYVIQLTANIRRFIDALLKRVEAIQSSSKNIAKELTTEKSTEGFVNLLNEQGTDDINVSLRVFTLRNQHTRDELEILDKQINLTYQRARSLFHALYQLYTGIAKDINLYPLPE